MRKGKTQHNYYSHIYFLSERQPDQKRKSTFLNGHHGDEKGALLSFFEMSLLLEMNLTHMVVVVILVLRDAALETIALCTFCTYETFARNRVKIVGYEQSGHF